MRLHYLLEENVTFESLRFAPKILQCNRYKCILVLWTKPCSWCHHSYSINRIRNMFTCNIPLFLIGWTNLFVFSDFSSTSPTWLNSITSCSSSWITTSTVRDDCSYIFWSICQGIFACICKSTWIVFLHICFCESIHISISPESLG